MPLGRQDNPLLMALVPGKANSIDARYLVLRPETIVLNYPFNLFKAGDIGFWIVSIKALLPIHAGQCQSCK